MKCQIKKFKEFPRDFHGFENKVFKQLNIFEHVRNQRFQMKAQIAMEYILIAVFILGILMIGTYIFREYAVSSRDQIIENKVEVAANALIDNAREIYYLGEGSIKIVTFEMPGQIESIFTLDADGEYFIIFNVTIAQGYNSLFYESDVLLKKDNVDEVSINGCYGVGGLCKFYYFSENEISQGIKKFLIENKKDYVDIEMVQAGWDVK